MTRRRVGAWSHLVAAVALMLLSLLAGPNLLHVFAGAASSAALVLAAPDVATLPQR